MSIIAFLQNQWFKDPARMRKIRNDDHWRDRPNHEWVRTWLFWGCKSGKVLESVFGEKLCDTIIWEETSLEFGGQANSVFPPDYAHMISVIDTHKPIAVMAFGKVASGALLEIVQDFANVPFFYYILGPHPAARQPNTLAELQRMHQQLEWVIEDAQR